MVKDEKEIINRSNKTISNAQLSNSNHTKTLIKASPLSLVTNVTADILNPESKAVKSKAGKFENAQNNFIAAFLATEADEQQV